VETFPIFWIDAVDVANASSEEINAKGDDLLALFWVSDFTVSGDAIFGSTDSTDLSLDGEAFVVGKGDEFSGLGKVLFDWEGAAIEHDARETSGDALFDGIIGAVVKVKGDWNGDAQGFVHGTDHSGDDFESAHVLGSASADTKDDRGFEFLSGLKDGFGPF
jgi:hypothetical protein